MAGETTTVREAVGVFDDAETLEAAIDELRRSGFDRAEISLLAGEHAVAEKLGHLYDKVEAVEDEPRAPRTAFVSSAALGDAEGALIGALTYVGAVAAAGAVVASGGTAMAAVIAATVAGDTGGLIGALLAHLLGRRHAETLQRQLDRGGLLLWVHVRDPEHERRAVAILGRHSAHDVHVHELRP